MKSLNAAMLLGLALNQATAEPSLSIGERAEVTLPFAEIRKLLDAASSAPTDEQPPIPAAVTKASLELSLGGETPTATAQFEVEVLAQGWQVVPLIGALFRLAEVSSDQATIVQKDGILCLVTNKPGRTTATLNFEVPPQLLGLGRLPLRFAPATAADLVIQSLPEGVEATFESGLPIAVGTPVSISTDHKETILRLAKDTPVLPTRWSADAKTVVRQREGRLVCETVLRLVGEEGSGVAATIQLPNHAINISVQGTDLLPADVPASRSLTLKWSTPGLLEREVLIRYDLPIGAEDGSWTVHAPEVPEATGSQCRVAVIPLPGTQLEGKDGKLVASDAPAWVGPLASGASVFVSGKPSFLVTARPRPRLEVDTARIPEARFQSRIEPDGARLCEAALSFQHRGPLRWRFSLPEDCELLSCQVDGRAENPIVLEDRQLELTMGDDLAPDADATSRVSLAYISRTDKLAPVEGRISDSLLRTSLFIQELSWTILLPDRYELTAFEGNVEPVPGQHGLTFRKRLVRNEAPALEIYYRKREIQH